LIDSNARIPANTFVQAGTYTVKLTVWNASGSDDEVKLNYITVNPVILQFNANTTSGKSPLSVKFTDKSTGNPTAWAWDFDNNGIIDSYEKSPVYSYAKAGTYSVRLTASNARSGK